MPYPVYFQHAKQVLADHPELVPGVLAVTGVTPDPVPPPPIDELIARAQARLASGTESELPQIQAWRRTFARMGLKPTQYRCAAESLLRRLRKEGTLPRIHPLIDLCNAVSVAFAVPVAVFDVDRVTEGLEVRYATGEETYLTFAGETERPAPGEVIFADAADRAHARRWTNRQSGLSAVRQSTTSVLIVAEAMHPSAPADIRELVAVLAGALSSTWPVTLETAVPSQESPRFG